MTYLTWDEKTITNFSDDNINTLYNEGYLFTREHLGSLYQTRSLRIDLNKFELSSENKRILKKTDSLLLTPYSLPYSDYTWEIGKLGKDFYETKFGPKTFSANKIKELLTTKHNFNKLFVYDFLPLERGGREGLILNTSTTPTPLLSKEGKPISYCICHETNELLHYSYPFYNLQSEINNLGIGMMLHAIIWAKENNKKYIYLGSAQRPTDTYKLQFAGLEWFDGSVWKSNLEELKNVLK